jgi:hypothetical protein
MTRLKSPRLILAVGLIAALSIAVVAQQRSTATSMTTAATAFLASLTPEQRQQATFAFDSAERLRWHFVPQFERNGLQIKAMTEPQRKLAHELLKTGLSARGYDTYTKIMQLENILRDVEKGSGPTRDPEGYRFSVFGTPAVKGAWGWRVEFHHISLHFSVVQWHCDLQHTVVRRCEPRGSEGRTAEGTADTRRARRHGACARDVARRRSA